MSFMTVAQPSATAPARVRYRTLPGRPEREWFDYRPASAGPAAPVLVFVHGISRRAAEFAHRLRDEADRNGVVVVAPLFRKEAYGQYQQVVDLGAGVRSDTALLEILEAVGAEAGIDVRRFYLAGVSGGAQFTHRFAWMHPDRLHAVGVLAAGWYTWPDPHLPYPLGLEGLPASGAAEAGAFDDLPIEVFVGADDTTRDRSVRADPAIDRLQGRTRLERARAWTAAIAARRGPGGVAPRLTVLSGAGHALSDAFGDGGLDRLLFQRLGLATP